LSSIDAAAARWDMLRCVYSWCCSPWRFQSGDAFSALLNPILDFRNKLQKQIREIDSPKLWSWTSLPQFRRRQPSQLEPRTLLRTTGEIIASIPRLFFHYPKIRTNILLCSTRIILGRSRGRGSQAAHKILCVRHTSPQTPPLPQSQK